MNKKTEFRPWGYFTVIAEGKNYKTKIINVNPNQKLSVQSHKYRSEHWIVLSGDANVLLNNNEFILHVGQSIDIQANDIHSLQNLTKNNLEILEVQMGEILSEEDIIRYSDIYGRV